MNWWLKQISLLKLFASKKIKGSVLQMTLVVTLIITMSLSMFLLYRFYLKQFIFTYHSLVQQQENINSATLLLENETLEDGAETRIFDVGNNTRVKCEIQTWGFYSVANIETLKSRQKLKTMRLFGHNIFRQELLPSVYYTPEKKKFLSVGGNSYLAGELLLPENGLQKAFLEDKPYSRPQLHYGRVSPSAKTLPQISEPIENLIAQMQNNSFLFTDAREESTFLNISNNSFSKQAVVLRYDQEIQLVNKNFSGKLIIAGGDNLMLDSTCRVDNCIIVADNITLKQGFKGRGQFIAKNSFVVEKNVRIENPSALVLWNPASTASMEIADSSLFYADIIVNAQAEVKKPVLNIGKSNFCGQIYCKGMLQFKGTLFGSLYADYIVFIDHYFPVENYLYNACIDATRLPQQYVGISLFDSFLNKKYADTVY